MLGFFRKDNYDKTEFLHDRQFTDEEKIIYVTGVVKQIDSQINELIKLMGRLNKEKSKRIHHLNNLKFGKDDINNEQTNIGE
tara:strand:+ start:191 stop:436 length:246 start_codon:yes stop_codon:yes gene_type:complete